MPRYVFDVTDAGQLAEDRVGEESADDDEARNEVVSYLSDIAREAIPENDRRTIVAVARDERGDVVYEATLALQGRWWPGRG